MKRLSWSISSVKKISTKQQSDYLLLLGKLIGNGFSLKQAINCLCLLDTNKKVFLNIYQDLEKGQLISYSLRHLQLPPVIFNQLIIAQSNGNLYQTLIQSGQVLKNKVKQQNN
jgi:Type II secretory pathway, component PulF